MFQPLPDTVAALFDLDGKDEDYVVTLDMITDALGGPGEEYRDSILDTLEIHWLTFDCMCHNIFNCDSQTTTRAQFKQLYQQYYNEPFPEQVKFDLTGYDETYAAYLE